MSDESTIQILPPGSMTTGSADTTNANDGEPQATPITFEDRAPPAPVVHSERPSATSPEARLEQSVRADLRVVGVAWRKYQATHDRDAVYGYLNAVYRIVMKWKNEQRAWKSAGLALKIQGDTASMRGEPFAVVIRCTSAPDKVDTKTRSVNRRPTWTPPGPGANSLIH